MDAAHQMKTEIQTQLKITTKLDNCVVTATKDGKLNIGSVTIEVSELDEFCDTLKTSALAMFALSPPEREVRLSTNHDE